MHFCRDQTGRRNHLWIGGTSGLLRNVVDRTDPIAPTPARPIVAHIGSRAEDDEALQSITHSLPYSTRGIGL